MTNIRSFGLIQEVNVSYEYSTLLALSILMSYENKNSIELEKLSEFRSILISIIENLYDTGKIKYNAGKRNVIKVVVKSINEEECLKEFLTKYSKYFYIKDRMLCSTNMAKQGWIEAKLSTYNLQNSSFIEFEVKKNKKIKNILGISSIMKELEDFKSVEEELEKCYLSLGISDDENIKTRISLLLEKRNLFYHRVITSNNDLNAYYNELQAMLDEERLTYDVYPVDKDLWNESEYSENDYGDTTVIGELLNDVHQYATFSNKSLSSFRLIDDFMNLIVDNEVNNDGSMYQVVKGNNDNYSCVYTSMPNDEILFWMLYISKIDDLIAEHGNIKELLDMKHRLLYSIDNVALKLYDKASFDYHLMEYYSSLDIDIDSELYACWQVEAYYFIKDCFEGVNKDKNLILEKLLFVSVYYELTDVEGILEILEEYEDYTEYEEYKDIICGYVISLKKDNDLL